MTVVARTARADLTLSWVAKFGLHVGLLFLGLVLAYELRRPVPIVWWLTDPDAIRVVRWAGLYALIGAGVELVFQSERSAWRFASMREVVGLVRNVSITTGFFLGLIFFLDRGVELPRSVLPLTWLVSLALLVGFRMVWRLPHDPGLAAHFLPSWWPRPATDRMPLLIVGPMAIADRQLRLLQGDPQSPYRLVGVVTPNPKEVGLRLHGVPFVGDLASWRPSHSGLVGFGAKPHAIIFLEDPVQAYGFSTERIGELRRAGHTLLKPQSLTDIDGSPDATNRLEEIPLEDFLPRKPISLDPAPVRHLVAGRRVLVTGAGGSIGSELCRQLLALDCSHLSMVDHSEFLLFEIDRELERSRSEGSRRAILANVRDTDRVAEVVRNERPDIIFHAAALKHVIQAAVAHQATQFVLISTDKAVAPTNVMGATKRIAETLLDLAPKGGTRMTAVRFGNVLGSAGSVVPIFRDQIARGGPVTVTHPEVNRFFMTIPEAVQLVLHSAAISASLEGGAPRKFLLEMGESVRIADLARQMIELSGKIPDVDVMIEFTGLKAGEKLAEALSDEGEEVQPCVEGVMELLGRHCPDAIGLSDILALVDQSRQADDLLGGSVLEVVDRIRSGSRTEALWSDKPSTFKAVG
jgi:O-antigen biosynthesis protein WbqV